ncbi:RHS repeat-associated protein [Actinocorallia herbida]|uniref:RHS repeat-associated protein n=1 Tax=Actinocorallia herbida TaxID=58109 RepID=A0A3N1CZV2_9ACTN|nr:SpvB/TcaC N-terminal domain-containing protein [Actinocorallia herbida]ROO86776.1 RHS repeat-associated protein [Actinocorallia herbida]
MSHADLLGQDGGHARGDRLSRGPEAPAVTLPKGGGAIRGLGEKFAANPVTGTGTVTVPIATSQGRSGLDPELSLAYDSGSGNGAFGFGWSLSLPSISRKTDRGLPTYTDSDVFLLSGAEDLVPLHGPDDTTTDPRFAIRRHRPRIDDLYARIERWTRLADGDTHWRVITQDNLLSLYGGDPESRIADPENPARVYSWLLGETRDDKGNVVRYRYVKEDGLGVDLARPSERNRGAADDPRRSANRYLKRVEYGNRRPLLTEDGRRPRFLADLPADRVADAGFMFEVVFDYGEHDPDDPAPRDRGAWTFREDPFSSYRAGFEVRTTRRCQRILTFHHIPGGDLGCDGLVRSTDLAYSASEETGSGYSLLRSVTQTGHRRAGERLLRRSLPPLEFEYSSPVGPRLVQEIDPGMLRHLPAGVDPAAYQWVDLNGEGVPGILTEQAGAWFYTRNLSPAGTGSVWFAPTRQVDPRPRPGLDGGRAAFMDLAGDGRPDLVVLDGPMPGLYERDDAEGWLPFRPFDSSPRRALTGDEVRMIDLDGDGRPDVLVLEDDAFVRYPSLGEAGFGRALRVPVPSDEERGPRLVFANRNRAVHFADLSGDGLLDLARIENGEICYWPNLGHGRFGAKVTMDGAPLLDHPEQFDQRRVRLADIDGTGTADLVYLHRDGVRLYYNRSGNGWSPARPLDGFPPIGSAASIQVTDLLGDGTSCLLWSSPLPDDGGHRMRYVRLTGERKPYLLIKTVNNLGVETLADYAPSTRFALQDESEGRPWRTRLPFPVHVVTRVETRDRIGRNRFVTRYAYHDGFFDGAEREFRGFGTVDQWDTEEIGALTGAADEDAAAHLPPVLTRTWFHTGDTARLPVGSLSPALPEGLPPEEEREARRALKGTMARQEIYAQDGDPRQEHPYSVVEHGFTVRLEQRRGAAGHAVFTVHPAETFERLHERDPDDPRVRHSIVLETDPCGNPLKEVVIGYGRRRPSPLPHTADQDRQNTPLLTYTENRRTEPIDLPDDHLTPLPAETRVFELTGYPRNGPVHRPGDFVDAGLQPIFEAEIGYEETAHGVRRRRLIEWTRVLYRADDLSALLPLGRLEPRALPGETYTLALTDGLLGRVLQRDGVALLPDPDTVLRGPGGDRGGYLPGRDLMAGGLFPATDPDGLWWVPSGQVFLSPDAGDTAAQELAHAREHFFLPCRTRDPFGGLGLIRYDDHDLLVVETRDAVGNRVTAQGNDYRVLQPGQVTDPNGNRTQVAYDALGFVVATAVCGRPGENAGDSLDGLDPDLTEAQIAGLLDSPGTGAHALLGRASSRLVYDMFGYLRTADLPDPRPAAVCVLTRETHDADLPPGTPTRIGFALDYSDGLGRIIQRKERSAPGPVMDGGPVADPRWTVSGWTVLNNKGLPVRTFEPFFSATHRFESGAAVGVGPVTFYDPLGRVVAVVHPDHTYEKLVFDPWRHLTWDRNDTVLADPRTDRDISGYVAGFFAGLPGWRTWHAERGNGDLGPVERAAAVKAAAHADTPTAVHLDVLGRPFLTVADCGGRPLTTRTALDIEGNRRAVEDLIGPDGLGRVVLRRAYDLMGATIFEHGADSGARWMIGDVLGLPLRSWDQRGHGFHTEYDGLRRPLRTFVDAVLIERLVYGEQHPEATARNLRGAVHLRLDRSGAVETEVFDFKGNPLRTVHRLASGSRVADLDGTGVLDLAEVEAALSGFLEPARHQASTTYDALDRPVTVTSPHTPEMAAAVVRYSYDRAGQVQRVDVDLGSTGVETPFVTAVDYDAHGRRTRIVHGNGVTTSYTYDPRTFRLVRMLSTRDGGRLQDLGYTYDPVGNVVHIRDDAQQQIFFANQVVEPSTEYTYDAVYRLIEATGREHLGQNLAPVPHSADDALRVRLPHPGDGGAMARYLEKYEYDDAGNLLAMRHVGGSGWTRRFAYAEPGTNRLTGTTTGQGEAEPYTYDAHGNLTRLPHLSGGTDPNLFWDHDDRLRSADLGDAGSVAYTYDADGRRVRKRSDTLSGGSEERVYLGDLEIHRRIRGDKTVVRETLHVMVGAVRVAMVETRTSGQDRGPDRLIRYQLADHRGSACLELDDQARIISYEEYTPYGSTSYQAVAGQTETPKRYRFTGRERDEETGLGYHGARYYAPWLARWTSCDPDGLGDGTNVYRYAHDDPIGIIDPAGTEGTPILTPSGQPTSMTWLDADEGKTSSVPSASLTGPSTVTTGRRALPAAPPPAAPAKPSEPEVSDPEALRRAEGMGHIEAGDVVQFGKGLWNGPASWVDAPQFEVDEHYAGAAEVGKELGKNLVIEAGTAGVGKAVEVATPFLRRAVRAPAFMFVGAGGVGGGLEAGQAGAKAVNVTKSAETAKNAVQAARVADKIAESGQAAKSAVKAAESGSAAASVRPDVPLHKIIPIDRTGTRAGKAYAPKVNPKPGAYRGVTPKMRKEAQRIGEKYNGPGKYDVGHRAPLSQTPAGERVRLSAEAAAQNRSEGRAIAEANAQRRKAGLYTRR